MVYLAFKHSVNDLGLCYTPFITLYTLWYQLIPHKAHVFLPRLLRHISTSDIMTLPVIRSSIILQEVEYFENSTISSSLKGQDL